MAEQASTLSENSSQLLEMVEFFSPILIQEFAQKPKNDKQEILNEAGEVTTQILEYFALISRGLSLPSMNIPHHLRPVIEQLAEKKHKTEQLHVFYKSIQNFSAVAKTMKTLTKKKDLVLLSKQLNLLGEQANLAANLAFQATTFLEKNILPFIPEKHREEVQNYSNAVKNTVFLFKEAALLSTVIAAAVSNPVTFALALPVILESCDRLLKGVEKQLKFFEKIAPKACKRLNNTFSKMKSVFEGLFKKAKKIHQSFVKPAMDHLQKDKRGVVKKEQVSKYSNLVKF